jgi:hypothetical protein
MLTQPIIFSWHTIGVALGARDGGELCVGASGTQLVLRSVREKVVSWWCFGHTAGGALGAQDGDEL